MSVPAAMEDGPFRVFLKHLFMSVTEHELRTALEELGATTGLYNVQLIKKGQFDSNRTINGFLSYREKSQVMEMVQLLNGKMLRGLTKYPLEADVAYPRKSGRYWAEMAIPTVKEEEGIPAPVTPPLVPPPVGPPLPSAVPVRAGHPLHGPPLPPPTMPPGPVHPGPVQWQPAMVPMPQWSPPFFGGFRPQWHPMPSLVQPPWNPRAMPPPEPAFPPQPPPQAEEGMHAMQKAPPPWRTARKGSMKEEDAEEYQRRLEEAFEIYGEEPSSAYDLWGEEDVLEENAEDEEIVEETLEEPIAEKKTEKVKEKSKEKSQVKVKEKKEKNEETKGKEKKEKNEDTTLKEKKTKEKKEKSEDATEKAKRKRHSESPKKKIDKSETARRSRSRLKSPKKTDKKVKK